ncbi:MAG: TIGR02266 family protein, partial [Polyangia bacterium]
LRYADVETFVEKFAPNVTRGGIFLASRNVQPVGADVEFELQLAAGEIVLAGQGRVSWVKEYDAAEPNRPYGMGVQFVSLTPESKTILARILRAKEASGGQGRRATTGPLTPLAASGSGRYGSGPVGSGNSSGVIREPATSPRIDTSVDLAAEYGLDEQKVRRLVERTWMLGARTSDDLADLLKPEPVEPVTLAQALAELPRLLDPQYSRRRASSGFRPLDPRGVTAVSPAADSAGQVVAASAPVPVPVGESNDPAYSDGATDDPTHHDLSPTVGGGEVTENATADITEERDAEQSIEAVAAEPTPAMNGWNSGHKRKRR